MPRNIIPLLRRSVKHARKRQAKDVLYVMLCKQCKALGLPEPQTEYKFHPERKWRFDFAWPAWTDYPDFDKENGILPKTRGNLAIEIQGGTFTRGRHSRGAGQHNDYEKMNEAQRLGWRVLQFDSSMLSSQRKRQQCVDLVLEMLQ